MALTKTEKQERYRELIVRMMLHYRPNLIADKQACLRAANIAIARARMSWLLTRLADWRWAYRPKGRS